MGCADSAEKKDEKKDENNAPNQDAPPVESVDESTQQVSPSNRSRPRSEGNRSKPPSVAARSVAQSSQYRRISTEPNPIPPVPLWLQPDVDSLGSSSSSAPQLFRITPTNHLETTATGTWEWWNDQVQREKVSKDGISRERLQDLPNHLELQHRKDPQHVEINLSQCYMERTAPYVVGGLLSSSMLPQLNWVTSLRLDGNFFSPDGFGNLLATLATANEKRPVLPKLEELYLNNMNLGRTVASAIFSVLFPINMSKSLGTPTDDVRVGNNVTARSPLPDLQAIAKENDTILHRKPTTVVLFPSLKILSLSDNRGLEVSGLIHILRSLIATHYEASSLSVLDLSRCGIDMDVAHQYLDEFLNGVQRAYHRGNHPVIPNRVLLMGNSMKQPRSGGRSGRALMSIRDPDIRVEA